MTRAPHVCCWLLVALVACALGCGPHVRMPNLFSPGPLGYQRYNALSYDPYPSADEGPPIVGGRPLAFQAPVPEVQRSKPYPPTPPRPGYPWR